MSEAKQRLVFTDAARIPVHLISGFLGSGKTTLLRRLLDHCVGRGLTPAVMLNEYGEVNIDGELLRGQGFSIREMTNGCICCTIGGTLGLALQEVAERKPDVILIEATGLADPVELIDQATKEEVLPLVRLASLIAVLDPVHFDQMAAALHSGIRQQTELADTVILNKCDLADTATRARLETEVRRLNPRAEIICTQYATLGYTRLLDKPGQCGPFDRRPGTQDGSKNGGGVHDHFHTLTYLCDAPLVRGRFERGMRALPATVWRAKGFVRFADSDEQWMFQFVAGQLDMEWLDLLPEPPEHVVFIGKGFDRSALQDMLRECAAPVSQPGAVC